MSIGVNQLLTAASYFILAYYMTEADSLGGVMSSVRVRVGAGG